MKPPEDVDSYIMAAPRDVRPKLEHLRKIIKSTAPNAEERISYGMPYYDYNGRLVYFAAFKKHISLFVPPPVVEEHKRVLQDFETTKATVHFPFDRPIPVTLVKKLIKARMKKNEGIKKKR